MSEIWSKNVYWSTCKVPVIRIRFQWKFYYIETFEKYSNIKPHKNPSSGSRVPPAQNDRHAETYSRFFFCNFANVPKKLKYSRTPLIRINWEAEPPGYVENLDNWIFLWNWLHWQFEVQLLLSMYRIHLRLNLSTTPDLKF